MSLARFSVPFAVLALALALASPAGAGGINLSWDDCGSFGVAQKSFACNSNLAGNTLFASAIPDVAIPALNGQSDVLLIQTPSPTLPAWWQRQTGGCNAAASFTASSDFTSFTNCVDPWMGVGAAGVIVDYPVSGYGPDTERVRMISAVPAGTEQPVDNVHEIYLIRVFVKNAKSTGVGACAGCTQSACIVLQSVTLEAAGAVPAETLTNPLLRQHIVWQDAAPLVGCPGATPARARTWGSVQSLYR